ncbi:hypothetical protein FJT64_024625 [Amphibalanus amphitrite]|uniref:DUF4764 domain-containing protein n=1 Tax=Amphibalanus amphitrite TaxID=1232801 RepID=A0A6A4WMI1_AMPAM|nr:hypothetical protein FJT64_024625 [Amphibalanus amphitrite]
MSGGQRVFLVDGQAVYLEGDGDVTEDVLQQALSQLATGGTQPAAAAEEEPESEADTPKADQTMDSEEGIVLNAGEDGDEQEGVLAILQDETGQQQTVRLTPDQAAALGIDYEQLVAAAAAGEEEAAATPGEPAAASESAPAEQTSAQEVASLATSVVLDLNESRPSLVNQSQGGDKVTYTFEVVDKDAAAGTGSGQRSAPAGQQTGLLTKARDIMVPRVRTGDARQIQQQIHKTAAQVLRTNTPSAPVPRDPITGGYISPATLKKGPVYNTGPNAQQNNRRTIINTASTVQQKAQSSASASMPTVSATSVSGDPSAADPDEDVDDLPVILTPVSGSEPLPDYIEPRPGMKILVRPLDMASVGGGDGPAPARPVGSSDNPIQLVQQGNTFKSLQPLSHEQLKQIASVLQQSRLNVPSNSKNSLYDADTNTRIVYRVVYPEDVGRGGGRGRGRRGRGRGRGSRGSYTRKADDADVDWSPELSRKAERKRLATKTRTGRVSKPPKHMVKDYRRLHRLDFNEPDLDDSDGGYSEWDEAAGGGDDELTQDSTELSNDASAAGSDRLEASLSTPASESKPKRTLHQAIRERFTCRTCNTLFIGYMRLEGHFAKFPDHERPPYVPPKGGTPFHNYHAGSNPRGARGRGRGRGRGRPPRHAYGYTSVSAGPSAKRLRLEEPEFPAARLVSQLEAAAGGSVHRLCDSMSAVLDQFRERVRSAVTPLPARQRIGVTATSRAVDGPVLKVDEERASLTGLPLGTYVLWPVAPEPDDDPGESMGDVGEDAADSPAPAEPASAASPSAAAALGEAVMAAVSDEGSPPAAEHSEQASPEGVTAGGEVTEAGIDDTLVTVKTEDSEPEEEASAAPSTEPAPPVEKDVLSAAELSQVALSATEGAHIPPPAAESAHMPPPADVNAPVPLPSEPPPAPLPTTNGGTLPLSDSEAAHRAVSDVLDEFVDGLVDAPEYPFTGEPVSEIDSTQLQLKITETETLAATATGNGDMPLVGDDR